jgi:hypothetical protein
MNDDLLKEAGGGNYFDELLARIRDTIFLMVGSFSSSSSL